MGAASALSSRRRLAIVGAGWIASHGYGDFLRNSPSFEPTAVFDPDITRASAFAATIGAKVALSFEAALSMADAVMLTHPSGLHPDDSIRALERGISVLCEKPIAASRSKLLQIQIASESSGATFWPANVCRHRKDVQAWLAGVARIGPITRIELAWRRRRGIPASASWAIIPCDGLTGVFADLGHHLCDLALAAAWPDGRTSQAHLTVESIDWDGEGGAQWYGAPDETVVSVPTATRCAIDLGGIGATIDVAWSGNPDGDFTRLEAVGQNGQVVLEGLFGFSPDRAVLHQRVMVSDSTDCATTHFEPGPRLQKAAFGEVLAEFASALEQGRSCDWGAAATIAGLLEDVWHTAVRGRGVSSKRSAIRN